MRRCSSSALSGDFDYSPELGVLTSVFLSRFFVLFMDLAPRLGMNFGSGQSRDSYPAW